MSVVDVSKQLRLLAALGALLVGGNAELAAQSPLRTITARDVVSEAELRERIASTKSIAEQLATQTRPVTGTPPNSSSSLYERSIILYDGEMHTLIPLGSVLHLPAELRSRIVTKATGSFTFWPNFLKRNAAWLGTREVPLDMAKGDAKAAKSVLSSLVKEPRLMVSVYRDGPISIMEAPPAEGPAEGGISRTTR